MSSPKSEEFCKQMKHAKFILQNKIEDLISTFDGSISALISYNNENGTIAHVCVYMRNLEILRKIIDHFEDHSLLCEWLNKKDSNSKTVIDLAARFEFREMYLYLSKIVDVTDKKQDFILKEGLLEKYTNVMNGFRERKVALMLDTLVYSRKNGENPKELKLKDFAFQHTKCEAKIVLKNKKSFENYEFKSENVDELADWACLIQNVIEGNNRMFYFKNYIFKLLHDAANAKAENLPALMKLSGLYPYYITEGNVCSDGTFTRNNILIDGVKEFKSEGRIDQSDENSDEFFDV